MPFYDVTTTPSVGDATKLDDYTRLRDSIRSIASGGTVHDFGGDVEAFIEDTSPVRLPRSWVLQIDGTYLDGRTALFEINVQADAPAVVEMQLWRIAPNAPNLIASSTLSTTLGTAFALGHNISAALTLATGVNVYEVRIRRVSGGRVAGQARVVIRG